jgi:hypothetical protein
VHESSPIRQLYPKIALPILAVRWATFLHIKFNTMQPTLIPECGLDPIFKGKWYRYCLDVRMASLG